MTAEEKFKQLLSGEFNRHVYYRCTKKVDLHCPEKYINETKLIELLENFISENAEAIKISRDLRSDIEKHSAATEALFEHYGVNRKLDKPIIEYARYVLNKGSFSEKVSLTKGITPEFLTNL